jgi:hypothetical protein
LPLAPPFRRPRTCSMRTPGDRCPLENRPRAAARADCTRYGDHRSARKGARRGAPRDRGRQAAGATPEGLSAARGGQARGTGFIRPGPQISGPQM